VSVLYNSECSLQQWVFFATVSVLCNSECTLQQWVFFATAVFACTIVHTHVHILACTHIHAYTQTSDPKHFGFNLEPCSCRSLFTETRESKNPRNPKVTPTCRFHRLRNILLPHIFGMALLDLSFYPNLIVISLSVMLGIIILCVLRE
jgi:hypothetical protein